MKRITALFSLLFAAALAAQQPQTQQAPLFPVNAEFTNGVAPGYAPTAGTGLVLDLSKGTAYCSSYVVTPYAGGTLTLTASTTNYVYLDTAASCVPASNTTGFTSSSIPIATVTTGISSITAIADDRTMFFAPGSGASGFTAGGDLSGTIASQIVQGILGHALPALGLGYIHWTGSAWAFDTPAGGASTTYTFQRAGVIFGTSAANQYVAEEASVIYEGSPHLLTGYSKVFKMWYSQGAASPGLYYAESASGMPGTWSQGSEVIANCVHVRVLKNGATYHAYCPGSSTAGVEHYTSTDGISWTDSGTAFTATQAWQQAGGAATASVVPNGTTWYALVEWESTDGIWRIGLWTNSASGADGSWVPYSGNPVLPTNGTASTGMCGGMHLFLIGSTLYTTSHCNGVNGTGTGNYPTDIYATESSDFGQTWTFLNSSNAWLRRSTDDEGPGLPNSQVADADPIDVTDGSGITRTYMFYTAAVNGSTHGSSAANDNHLKLAIAPTSLENLFVASSVTDSGTPGERTVLLTTAPTGASSQGFPGEYAVATVNGGKYTLWYDASSSQWQGTSLSQTWAAQDFADFSGSAGTLLSAYTTQAGKTFVQYSSDGATPQAMPATSGSATAILTSGTSTTYGDVLDTLTPSSANYTVSGKFTYNSAAGGNPLATLFGRANSSAATYYILQCSTGNAGSGAICNIYKDVTGTTTQLGSAYGPTWNNGSTHTLALVMNGTSISATFDGATVIGPVTDSGISAAGQAGLRITGASGMTVTNFTVQ